VLDTLLNQFSSIVSASENELNLAEAALIIAKHEYPGLDVPQYLKRFDQMAAAVSSRLASEQGALLHNLQTLNDYLYEEEGFSGNLSDYSDPRNSFLNDVLDRRAGIPITLSLVHLEVGRRVGLPLEGVSFPGHFLVKLELDGAAVVLDPFHQGVSLSEDELKMRAEWVLGEEVPVVDLLPSLLEGASKRDILVRMLRNLKGIYREREDPARLIQVMDMILSVKPDLPDELRARGDVYREMAYFGAALTDYRRYLTLAPDADDTEKIREHVITLQALPTALH